MSTQAFCNAGKADYGAVGLVEALKVSSDTYFFETGELANSHGTVIQQMAHRLGVGEQTGALDAMLSKIADFYEEEVDQAVANLLTLMEPVMIAFLGVTVGGIVVSMYLPLFDLISKLS